ncbi:MAG: hypothetical protein K5770_09445 [Lachnospiraceae bacterium]|nr:hypothetical protein [Lachnospiraceae bacterium]
MKELIETAAAFYENCRGTGKLFVLFAAAVLIIILIQKKVSPAGFNPAVFLLSVRSGIAYAFTLLFKTSENPQNGRKSIGPYRILSNIVLIGLITITIILGGKRVIAGEFYEPAENTLHLKTRHVMVMDRLLELAGDESVISVIATPQIAPFLKQYSSRFMPLYDYSDTGSKLRLNEGAQIVYNEYSSSVPRMDRITRIGHKEDYRYLLVDTVRYYPELKASEFGYELLDTVEGMEIYRRIEDL